MTRRRRPLYFTVRQIVDLFGDEEEWPIHRVRRWLLREKAVVKRSGKWVTTIDKLRATFPEVANRIDQERFEREHGL
jgi:hypothetical protein